MNKKKIENFLFSSKNVYAVCYHFHMLVMVIVIAAADIEIKTYTLSMRFPCIVDVDDSSASSWQTLYEVPRQLFFEVLPHRYIDDFADGAQLYNLYCFTNDFDESRLYFQFTCIQRLY